MRYLESRERCAEFLRLALARMGRHPAGFHPITFTVWYECAAGINPALGAEIAQLEARGQSLDDAEMLRLYHRHIAPADAEALERIGHSMQQVMAGVAQSASHTGQHADRFGAQIGHLAQALAASDAPLAARLDEVQAGATQMKQSVDALQRQLGASQQEIARLRSDLDRVRSEAMVDPLTGVLNRGGFEQRIQALFGQPPAADPGHSLIMLDLDHFKHVNDTHGHLMGDRVLKAVGEVLRATVTQPGHCVARYGGEEFVILLPRTPVTQAAQLAEAVRTRTRAMKIRHKGSQDLLLTVTVSGGLAESAPGDDAQALIERADQALYQSKHNGRDRVSVHGAGSRPSVLA